LRSRFGGCECQGRGKEQVVETRADAQEAPISGRRKLTPESIDTNITPESPSLDARGGKGWQALVLIFRSSQERKRDKPPANGTRSIHPSTIIRQRLRHPSQEHNTIKSPSSFLQCHDPSRVEVSFYQLYSVTMSFLKLTPSNRLNIVLSSAFLLRLLLQTQTSLPDLLTSRLEISTSIASFKRCIHPLCP